MLFEVCDNLLEEINDFSMDYLIISYYNLYVIRMSF